MKLVLLLSSLAGFNASAQVPSRTLLKCQNAAQDRTLKIEETAQSYAIKMTDFAEKQLIGSSYVYKSPNVSATARSFTVRQINGTEEYYSIEIQSLYGTNEPESYLGEFATIHGWAPGGATSAKEKVFRTLVPEAPKFDLVLLKCTQ